MLGGAGDARDAGDAGDAGNHMRRVARAWGEFFDKDSGGRPTQGFLEISIRHKRRSANHCI